MTTGRAVVTAMRGHLVIPSRGVAGQRQGLAAAPPQSISRNSQDQHGSGIQSTPQ